MATAANGGNGEAEGQVSVKLERKDKRWIMGIIGIGWAVLTGVVVVMFYVFTPTQKHNADIAAVREEAAAVATATAVEKAVNEVKTEHAKEKNKIVQRRLSKIGEALDAMGKNQAVLMDLDGVSARRRRMPKGLGDMGKP